MPSSLETNAIYADGDYLRANPSWHVQDSAWKARHIAALLREHSISPATVCEVGCGAGEILARLHDELPQATLVGYDISPDAIALARTRARERLSFELGALPDTDGGGDAFDLAIAADVFEHVDDYLGFLHALRGTASWAVFHIPLDLSALNLVRRAYIMRARERLGHLHHFDADTAIGSLQRAGYTVVDAHYTSGAIDLSEGLGRGHAVLNYFRRAGARVKPDLTARLIGGFSLLVLARPASDGQGEARPRIRPYRPQPR